MSEERSRSYLAIAAAIAIAGVLISVSLFVAVGEGAKITTITTTSVSTSVSTTTATPSTKTVTTTTETTAVSNITVTITGPPVTSTFTACNASPTLYCVVFQQTGACSPQFWALPWAVTIGNTTEVQPAGTPIPLTPAVHGNLNVNLTIIVFSLPNGTYPFSVSNDAFFTPDSGTVVVNGTDVLVQIAYTGTSCLTSTTKS